MTQARIRDLEPGTRFRYEFGRVAVLDGLGESGARIRYESPAIDEESGTAPGRMIVVSDDSLVTVLEQ